MSLDRFRTDPETVAIQWRHGYVQADLFVRIDAALRSDDFDDEERAGLLDQIEKAMTEHGMFLRDATDLPARVRRLLHL